MKLVVALGSIPMVVLGAGYALMPATSPTIAAKPVVPETITARRQDDASFNLRWTPVGQIAPAIVIHYANDEREVPATEAAPLPPARIVVRQSSLLRHRDICARHGMRRQYYTTRRGWTAWRCRR